MSTWQKKFVVYLRTDADDEDNTVQQLASLQNRFIFRKEKKWLFELFWFIKQQNLNRAGSLTYGRERLLFIITNPFLHSIPTIFRKKCKQNYFKKVWSKRIQTKRKLDTNSATVVSAQLNARIKQICRSTQFDSCRIPLQHNSKFLNLYINQCF